MDSKTLAIISYITIIGWVAALVLDKEKDPLVRFHLRQSLALIILGFICAFIPFLNLILWIVPFVFWIMGLISAIQGQQKPLPLIGEPAQKWFANL
ncbi:MAG: hypothetical protein Q7P63_17990 [Verrucomicrobiota bacterium JB022]|nr:hypothetical protein [Verrucomicrobiota bacterium JB022]